jgi:acetylornithine aminotransferase
VQAGFEPLVQGFVRVPFDDLEAVRAVARNSPDVAAVLVEPIQGEGGIRLPTPGYLAGLREICDTHGWLLMLDEIQTGIARTGRSRCCLTS